MGHIRGPRPGLLGQNRNNSGKHTVFSGFVPILQGRGSTVFASGLGSGSAGLSVSGSVSGSASHSRFRFQHPCRMHVSSFRSRASASELARAPSRVDGPWGEGRSGGGVCACKPQNAPQSQHGLQTCKELEDATRENRMLNGSEMDAGTPNGSPSGTEKASEQRNGRENGRLRRSRKQSRSKAETGMEQDHIRLVAQVRIIILKHSLRAKSTFLGIRP